MPLWEVILLAGVVAVLLYLGIPWLYCRWNRHALRRLATEQNRLVLTLDDGPGRQLTTQVLQLLAATDVKATFFLLGRNIQQNEDLVRRIQAQGHEIGSHTYEHLHAWKVAPWRSVSDIRRGFQALDEALGTPAGRYPFRPPYGKMNLITLLYLLVRRIPIAYWTIDCCDTWLLRPAQSPAAELSRAAGGGIVLAHDFDRGTESVHQYVLDALRSTLSMARQQGLQVSTFSQLKGAGT